jgi:hypothetical protein
MSAIIYTGIKLSYKPSLIIVEGEIEIEIHSNDTSVEISKLTFTQQFRIPVAIDYVLFLSSDHGDMLKQENT